MIKFIIGILFGLMMTSAASAGVQVSGRQLIIFTAQPDELYGSYLFGVENDSKDVVKSTVKIMIPEETIDFRAVEGVEADQLKLSEKGSLTLEKEFKPGTQFTGLDFLVKAQFGKASMTFAPSYPIDELSLLVQKNSHLLISGPNTKLAGTMNLQQGAFDRYVVEGIKPGAKIILSVTGAPMGRMLFWWIGGAFSLILLIAAGIFAARTWPVKGS